MYAARKSDHEKKHTMATPVFIFSESEIRGLIVDTVNSAIRQALSENGHSAKNPDRLLNGAEAMTLLNVSRPTLARWRQAGKIPYLQIDDTIRYSRSRLLEAMGLVT